MSGTRQPSNNDNGLDLCLQQIEEPRPFFIAILGERYGYVPRGLTSKRAPNTAGSSTTPTKRMDFRLPLAPRLGEGPPFRNELERRGHHPLLIFLKCLDAAAARPLEREEISLRPTESRTG